MPAVYVYGGSPVSITNSTIAENRSDGIKISNASANIGGNTISNNGADGIRVDGTGATGNTISRNSIHSNGGKGIENVNGGNRELGPLR